MRSRYAKKHGSMFRTHEEDLDSACFREAETPIRRAFLTFFYYPRGFRGSRIESARLVHGCFRADSRTGAGFVEAERSGTFDFNDETRGYDGIINQPVSYWGRSSGI